MEVLVTGGAGFIGANLCRALVAEGHAVRVIDDLSTGRAANLDGLGVDLVEGSVLDAGTVAALAREADRIVHLAARGSVPRSVDHPLATHETNATGTLAVLEAARCTSVPVILASSSSVYGDTTVSPKHEGLPVAPKSPYAASKVAAEGYALAYQATYGLPVLALRFFNVYGPLQAADHDYAAVVPRFIDAALAGRPLEVHGDGRQSRDFTYVGTVVDALSRAVAGGTRAAGPVNLAFGTSTDLLEVIDLVQGLVGRRLEVVHTEPRPGDVRSSRADDRRLRFLFPEVRPVPLATGLAATTAWLREGVR